MSYLSKVERRREIDRMIEDRRKLKDAVHQAKVARKNSPQEYLLHGFPNFGDAAQVVTDLWKVKSKRATPK